MLPKTKLEFLDVTAQIASRAHEVKEMLEAEPMLVMVLAVYTGALARKFYPEESDDITANLEDNKRTTIWAPMFNHKVDDTTFVVYHKKKGDGKKDWRLRIYHETDVIGEYYFDNEGDAHMAILRYIIEEM